MTSDRGITYVGMKGRGGGGNRPGEDGPYRPPNPNEAPPYPPKKVASGPRLPKETSGGGGKGSGKPTKPKDVRLPGERFKA